MSLLTPTIETERLRLRSFNEGDGNAIFALMSDAEALRYWDAPPWSDRSSVTRFLTNCECLAAEGTGAALAVERQIDGEFVGWCTLNSWNPEFRSASLGFCYARQFWGHGYATEAGRGMVSWAFDTLDLNRLQAEADTRNSACGRVLQNLGFWREGTLREDCIVGGDVSDSWVFGLLREDWMIVESSSLEPDQPADESTSAVAKVIVGDPEVPVVSLRFSSDKPDGTSAVTVFAPQPSTDANGEERDFQCRLRVEEEGCEPADRFAYAVGPFTALEHALTLARLHAPHAVESWEL